MPFVNIRSAWLVIRSFVFLPNPHDLQPIAQFIIYDCRFFGRNRLFNLSETSRLPKRLMLIRASSHRTKCIHNDAKVLFSEIIWLNYRFYLIDIVCASFDIFFPLSCCALSHSHSRSVSFSVSTFRQPQMVEFAHESHGNRSFRRIINK